MKYFLYLSLFLVCCSSCKKDLLHWNAVMQLDATTNNRLNRILFINDSTGFIVGGDRFIEGDLLITHDGGNTWNKKTVSGLRTSLYAIATSPSGVIYAAGFGGKLIVSKDTGNSWESHELYYLPIKTMVVPQEDYDIMAGGASFSAGYTMYVDNNNGYANPYDSVGYEINDIVMADSKIGYLAGYGVVLKTNDGCKTWQYTEVHNDNFSAICCLDKTHAWVCGTEGSICKTTDGISWQELRNGNKLTQKKYHLLDILFTDEIHGYAVGENGTVIYSNDGGNNWSEFDKFTNEHLRAISSLADGSLLVCGDNGSLYKLQKR